MCKCCCRPSMPPTCNLQSGGFAAQAFYVARGGAKADLEGLADCVVRFATLCTDLADEIGEIDINPIILSATGVGLTAVDCLITKKTPKGD